MAIKFDTFKTGAGSVTGGLVYKGSYDAATQSPNLTTALKGDFYIVSVAGSLATIPLNVGDHIVFNQNASSPITSAMFDVIDNTDAVASVNSQTGVVVLDSDDIAEGSSNQYFTSARFTSEFNTKDTDSLTEGSSNLYYTNSRFDTQLGTKTTSDLTEGTNLYHTNARVDARIAAATANDLSDVSYTAGAGIDGYVMKYNNTSGNWEAQAESGSGVTSVNGDSGPVVTLDSDDIAEGSSNLYYTDVRFDTRLATKTTSDLSEGSNLYHTNARVDARIALATANDLSDVSYTAGAGIDGYVLKYNNTNSQWEAQAESGGSVGTLQQVTDQGATTTTNISTAQITVGGDLLADGALTRTIGDETNRFITAHTDLNGAVRFKAKAGVALSKGDVVYISGVSGGVPTVLKAQANSASTMPAFGLCYANASLNADVQIVTLGNLDGINTGSFSLGDTLYVSETTAGALSNTAPTGESNLIQNIAKIIKVDGTGNSGIYKVGGAGRTAATPNLDSNKVFLGNGSNQAVSTALSAINLSSFNDDLVTNIVDDTTPQLGGNLDVNGNDVVSVSNGAINLAPDGTGKVTIKGNATGGSGQIVLNCEQNSHGITLKGPPHSAAASYTLTFPNTDGTADQVLKTDGNGALDWVDQASGGGGFTYDGTKGAASFNAVLSYHYAIDTSGASANITMTLPAASSGGSEIRVKLLDATYSVIVAVQTGETLDTTTNGTTTLSVANQSITLVDNGSTGWEIV
jgi:hypothetical protein